MQKFDILIHIYIYIYNLLILDKINALYKIHFFQIFTIKLDKLSFIHIYIYR